MFWEHAGQLIFAGCGSPARLGESLERPLEIVDFSMEIDILCPYEAMTQGAQGSRLPILLEGHLESKERIPS
jgi:hypothetical protein